MQSVWRVACVRIPRFPIGAVWRQRAAAGTDRDRAPHPLEAQLPLPLPSAAPPSPASSGAPSLPPPSPLPATPSSAHWDSHPIALAEAGRLKSVTAAAGRARVRAGMWVAEARSRCAALDVLAWDGAAIDRAIVEATASFVLASPQVTPVPGAPGRWWIGAGGFETGTIAGGATSAPIRITNAGSLAYFCRIHPSMVATLNVTP